MADLDKTSRYALKLAPTEVLAWLLPTLSPDLAFHRWADTEIIAFPGEPARRCDTVAELVSESSSCGPWLLVLEVEARSRSSMFIRVLEYECRLLRKLRHGPHRKDMYQISGVVLYLTGKRKNLTLSMTLPGTDLGLHVKVGSRCLAEIKADVFLAHIEGDERRRGLLPWVPLMAGAHDPTLVQKWVRLAVGELDIQRRIDYAGLALVFADRAGCGPVWKKELEGFEMWQSEFVREWKMEGRVEGRVEGRLEGLVEGRLEGRVEEKRTDLIKVLQLRFAGAVTADLLDSIQQSADLDLLVRAFDLALTAASIEEVRSLLQHKPNGKSPAPTS